MTGISFERNKSTYLSNFKMKLNLQVQATDNRPSTSNDIYINNVYTDNVYINKVKPLKVWNALSLSQRCTSSVACSLGTGRVETTTGVVHGLEIAKYRS